MLLIIQKICFHSFPYLELKMHGLWNTFVNYTLFFLVIGYLNVSFSQPNDNWRKKNDLGNRYEGVVTLEVGAGSIKLLSLTIYKEKYNTNDTLRVKFYLHRMFDNNAVKVVAQELTKLQFYWMESKPSNWQQGWNEFSPWPVDLLLKPLDINANNLGITIEIGKINNYSLFAPAIVYHSTVPQSFINYKSYFFPVRPIYHGRYWIYRIDNNELLEYKIFKRHPAEQPFPIYFQLDSSWRGLVKFKMEIYFPTDALPADYTFYFYHNMQNQ